MNDIPEGAVRCGTVWDAWMWRVPHPRHTVLRVTGELDVYTVPSWRDEMKRAIDEGHGDLIVVVEAVPFFDSTALGAIVGCLKYARQHDSTLLIVDSDNSLEKIFRITGLTKVFSMSASLEDAIAEADREAAARTS